MAGRRRAACWRRSVDCYKVCVCLLYLAVVFLVSSHAVLHFVIECDALTSYAIRRFSGPEAGVAGDDDTVDGY